MRITRPLFILFTLWVIGSAVSPIKASAQSHKVAILPFDMTSNQDYTYIQQGIVDMLTSRLAASGQIDVIHSATIVPAAQQSGNPGGNQAALAVGTRLGADYVLRGSLVVLEHHVTIQAEMLAIADGQPALAYSRQNLAMGDVIPEINGLANQIVSQVFHLPPPTSAAPQEAPKDKASEDTATHAHPEKLLENIDADHKEE